MTAAMHELADRLGVPAGDARLLRLTNNAVFALPAAGLVIRITRSHGLHERVHKVVRLATWFARLDAPTIRLAPGIDQPLAVNGLLASVWQYLPPGGCTPDVTDLARVLRRFHQLPHPPDDPPLWDPVGDALTRLDDAEALPPVDREALLGWCSDLAPRITALNTRINLGLVHGDAHTGNLLRRPDGQVVLCDFDPTCRGPWQVDLVAVAVGEARFHRPGAHHALATAYGYDVTTDPDWPLLREARELKMVAAAVPLLASAPGVAAEFRTRLNSITSGNTSTRWTPFADLRP
jgi:aminoglycoside phosphotransferase (APT) family kinase protein